MGHREVTVNAVSNSQLLLKYTYESCDFWKYRSEKGAEEVSTYPYVYYMVLR